VPDFRLESCTVEVEVFDESEGNGGFIVAVAGFVSVSATS
jgi:hypothetical protein